MTMEDQTAQRLANFVVEIMKEANGRARVEDVISTAAAIVGERCIEAAGDFNPRVHTFVPGSRIFSDKINDLISGDVDDWSKVPANCVVGILRAQITAGPYDAAELPSLTDVYGGLAASTGDTSSWGWVPLSVPVVNRPTVMPLRIAFETREAVGRIVVGIRNDTMRCLRVTTTALAKVLCLAEGVIDHRVALLLAIETINGMAKTAPMTIEALQGVASETKGPEALRPASNKAKPWWRFW